MDDRLQDGRWMERARQAHHRPEPPPLAGDGADMGIPIGDDYASEATEWTPLTRRAAAGAFTPVPVSRRAGMIAGGVVLGAGGLGVVGSSVVALTVGLLIGAYATSGGLAPEPAATEVAQADAAPAEAPAAAPVRQVEPGPAVDGRSAEAEADGSKPADTRVARAEPEAPSARRTRSAPQRSARKASTRRSAPAAPARPAPADRKSVV